MTNISEQQTTAPPATGYPLGEMSAGDQVPTERVGDEQATNHLVINEAQVADELERFLREQFPATASRGVARDVDLFETGVVDSVGVAETIAYLEERYQVQIPDEILVSDAFTTIAGIAHTIATLIRPQSDA